jgi:hypothetical protein
MTPAPRHLGARGGVVARRRDGKQCGQPAAAFRGMAAHVPEQPHRTREPQPARRVAAAGSPGQRRAQVVVLGLQPVQPGPLVCARQVRLGGFGQREKMREVPLLPAGLLAAFAQPVARILAHGLEQPIARSAGIGLEERLFDERAHEIEYVGGTIAATLAASTASSVKPPANTATRMKGFRSVSERRS